MLVSLYITSSLSLVSVSSERLDVLNLKNVIGLHQRALSKSVLKIFADNLFNILDQWVSVSDFILSLLFFILILETTYGHDLYNFIIIYTNT